MNLPPSMGAPGKPATFTGSNGMKSTSPANPFGNMGSREGGVSHIPGQQQSGAFEEDLSCREYTGNPRDNAAGS